MAPVRILVAEDDRALADFVRKGLEAEQYTVDCAEDGITAGTMAHDQEYDLLILDLNLPGTSGVEVLAGLRAEKPTVPVLVLTARSGIEDRVRVLDLGADDYLTKPFSFSELTARVRALLRRSHQSTDSLLRIEDLELNRVGRKVARGGESVELTPKEFALLEFLMLNAPRHVSRTMIMEHVWNTSFDTQTNVVDVYINYLRKKVDGGRPVKLIHTIRGVGYCIGKKEDV